MIKTVGLLAMLLLLYGLAGRADFEIAEATAKERSTCPVSYTHLTLPTNREV